MKTATQATPRQVAAGWWMVGSVVVALRVRPNSKLPERSVWNAAALMVLDASQTCTITKPCKDVSMRFSF